MFGFLKKSKSNHYRVMCGQALATAQAIFKEIDNTCDYEDFKYHVTELKYHSTNARKYFKKIEWDEVLDKVLVDSDIEKLETAAIELNLLSEEAYKK